MPFRCARDGAVVSSLDRLRVRGLPAGGCCRSMPIPGRAYLVESIVWTCLPPRGCCWLLDGNGRGVSCPAMEVSRDGAVLRAGGLSGTTGLWSSGVFDDGTLRARASLACARGLRGCCCLDVTGLIPSGRRESAGLRGRPWPRVRAVCDRSYSLIILSGFSYPAGGSGTSSGHMDMGSSVAGGIGMDMSSAEVLLPLIRLFPPFGRNGMLILATS